MADIAGDRRGGAVGVARCHCHSVPSRGVASAAVAPTSSGSGGRSSSVVGPSSGDSHQPSQPASVADPQFELTEFLARADDAFLQVQRAWQQRDLTAIRHFVSDGLAECLTFQLSEQPEQGNSLAETETPLEATHIGQSQLVEAHAWPQFDALTVKFTARCVRYRVSRVAEPDAPRPSSSAVCSQYWTFVRQHGAQTTDQPGLIEGACPACQARIATPPTAACDGCGILLRSGHDDWVLTDMVEAADWVPQTVIQPEVAHHGQTQNAFESNLHHIADRMSVIFFRKASADRQGATEPLLKLATADLCRAFDLAYQRGLEIGERRYFGACELTASQVRGFVTTDETDYALVELRWAAQTHLSNAAREIQTLDPIQKQRVLALLIRSHGVQPCHEAALYSAHCPGCFRPDTHPTRHACESCDTVLNDGSQDWVLAAWYPFHSHEAQSWLQRVSETSADSSYNNLADFKADLPVSQFEGIMWLSRQVAQNSSVEHGTRDTVERLAHAQGVPAWLVDHLWMRAALADPPEALEQLAAEHGHRWLTSLTDRAVAQGNIDLEACEQLLTLIQEAALLANTEKELDTEPASPS